MLAGQAEPSLVSRAHATTLDIQRPRPNYTETRKSRVEGQRSNRVVAAFDF